jgi:hypothetical protein
VGTYHLNDIYEDHLNDGSSAVEVRVRRVRISQGTDYDIANYLPFVSTVKSSRYLVGCTMIEEPTIRVILRPHLSTPPVVIRVALNDQ